MQQAEWIPQGHIMLLVFVFYYKAIKSGEVDCCGMQHARFIRCCANEATPALELLPFKSPYPFNDSLHSVISEDSYPRQIWSTIMLVQAATRKLMWSLRQSQVLMGISVNIPLAWEAWMFFTKMLSSAAKGQVSISKCIAVHCPSLAIANHTTIYKIEYMWMGSSQQLAEAQSLFGVTFGVWGKKHQEKMASNGSSGGRCHEHCWWQFNHSLCGRACIQAAHITMRDGLVF